MWNLRKMTRQRWEAIIRKRIKKEKRSITMSPRGHECAHNTLYTLKISKTHGEGVMGGLLKYVIQMYQSAKMKAINLLSQHVLI